MDHKRDLLRKRWGLWVIWIVLSVLAGFPAISQAKDTLVVALQGEPEDGFDPVMGWGRYGHPLFYSTLLARDDDLRIVNDLAVSHAVSPDSRLWLVAIRDDVVFSDGTPLTAEDVAFTYNKAAVTGGKADLSSLDRAVATSGGKIPARHSMPLKTTGAKRNWARFPSIWTGTPTAACRWKRASGTKIIPPAVTPTGAAARRRVLPKSRWWVSWPM